MALSFICTILFLLKLSYGLEEYATKVKAPYKYQIGYFEVAVDHFSFTNRDTYKMRYLINNSSWVKNGPILFYCGNEGDIEAFATNTGFMWDIAGRLKAMIVFAEHRYYGESMPYGNASFQDANHLGLLTSEQALADYAVFLTSLKHSIPGAEQSPVIAFGGSYGGMLASWMRAKYPQIVAGALAASAPVLQFQNVTPCETFNRIVTKTFARYGSNCVENIRRSWAAIDAMYAEGVTGQNFLKKTFKTCCNMTTKDDVTLLKAYMNGAWGNLAMVEYPYPADFLENLPAWPIMSICKQLDAEYWDTPTVQLSQLSLALQAYYNYSGSYSGVCLNIHGDPSHLTGASRGWNFQSCSEMIMPMCADNKQDFFEPVEWNLQATIQACSKQYSVTPKPWWVMTNYLGVDISGATNIIFSNGLLDPWHGGGVLESIPERNITALTIPSGAHHLDLRAANDLDPVDVIAAREVELNLITQWINDATVH